MQSICRGSGWWCWLNDSWSAVVGHVLRAHGQFHRWWVGSSCLHCVRHIVTQEGVVDNVDAKAGPIVSVPQFNIRPMYYVDILAHQTHLQA